MNIQQLNLIYCDAFGKKSYEFIKKKLLINDDFPWMKELATVIDDRMSLLEIQMEDSVSEKGVKVFKYLVSKGDIKKYNMFISIWKKFGNNAATQFQFNLEKSIRNVGLFEFYTSILGSTEAPEMNEDIELRQLQLVYSEAFGPRCYDFIRQNLNINEDFPWMQDLKSVIDDESYLHEIYMDQENEKAIKIFKYLTNKGDIQTYDAFITIWKKNGGKDFAEKFQFNLKKSITNNGLLEYYKSILNNAVITQPMANIEKFLSVTKETFTMWKLQLASEIAQTASMMVLQNVIDDSVIQRQYFLVATNIARVLFVIDYLLAKQNGKKYTDFVSIWKSNDENGKADAFKNIWIESLKTNGLTEQEIKIFLGIP